MNRGCRGGLATLVCVCVTGCAGDNHSRSPAAPSPPPTSGIPIAGVVYDTAYRPMARARIEVIDGPQAGMSTFTDSRGQFTLMGMFDDTTRFVATQDGHVPATSTLGPYCAACQPNRWIYFNLEEPVPPPDLSGHWQVTFATDPACTRVSDELRTRSYDATIALAPPAANPDARWLFEVTMNSAPFVGTYKGFRIGAAGTYLGFPDDDGPVVVEQLGPTTYLSFNALGWTNGAVAGASAGSMITTGFDSTEYCVLTAPFAGTTFQCPPGSSIAHSACSGHNVLSLIRR